MAQKLFQIVYKSKYSLARVDSTLRSLRDIVRSSKNNNAIYNVTGYLIFDGETFIQILEGNATDVNMTYNRIQIDPRHNDSEIILSRTVDARDFPDWSMGGFLQTAPIPSGITGEEAIILAKQLMYLAKKL